MAKLNFRKSVKLGNSGVRLNLSKRGVGMSTGVKGLRVGVGPSGARARASLPGTGLYMEKRMGASKRKATSKPSVDHPSNEAILNDYQAIVQDLQSYHKESVTPINWHEVIQNSPFAGEIGPRERQKRAELNDYQPNFFVRLFRLEGMKRKSLEQEIQRAMEEDKKAYENWLAEKELGEGVLQGDRATLEKLIQTKSTFYRNQAMAREIVVGIEERNGKMVGHVSIYALLDEEFPEFELSLTKTGKLSEKKLTKTKYYELLSNHVCSVTIRVMRELFDLTPVDELIINVYKKELDTAVGREKEMVILTLNVTRREVEPIHFAMIQPFDMISNLENHRMTFRKTKGFAEVEGLM
ncbi:DUF4236 domain-containing protein [Alkalihalophilus sp. As8PL]|uniref:DUF4236 domain-containing protein n=1 Tax=Alkalihalophilus sp. As8PL TaxID=3237103 RepID=A0AB39BW99_9BACI